MPFLRSVQLLEDRVEEPSAWPFTLPAIRALRDPLELDPRVTLLVGENGAGKSTLLEGLAVAVGMNAEGGSQNMAFATRPSHSSLHDALRVARTGARPRTRYFLRAESFYNVATAVDDNVDALAGHGGRSLHEQSHGESFLSLINHRFGPNGLYLLDEPEAAMSPQGLLALMARLHDLAADGSQLVIATHAPMLLAFPGATVLQLDETGIRRVAWDETDHVRLTRGFLDAPDAYLRHLLPSRPEPPRA
jgi:predicted ATPase